MATALILGGGFGGLAAANELRGLLGDGDEVVVVDRAERFYMGFAKLWDLAGMRPLDEGSVDLARLDDRGVRFVQAGIDRIDPATRTVESDQGPLTGDVLLVALGAADSPAHLAMLAGPGAHNLYDGRELPAMRAAIDGLDGGRVVVAILGGPFKCPPAPYEAALIVDELLRARGARDGVELTVVTPQPITLPVAGPDASRYVAAHLDERGIGLRAGQPVKQVDGDRRTLTLADGTTLEYDLLLGVPATVPPPVVKDSPLAAQSGWIEPDRTTLRTTFDGVYAVGDCTQIPTAKGQLPKAGVFAAGEGIVAARNMAADLGKGEPATFDGHGFCFLELPGRRVAFVEGDFFAEPDPDVHLTEADEEQFRRKQEYEQTRLRAWLG